MALSPRPRGFFFSLPRPVCASTRVQSMCNSCPVTVQNKNLKIKKKNPRREKRAAVRSTCAQPSRGSDAARQPRWRRTSASRGAPEASGRCAFSARRHQHHHHHHHNIFTADFCLGAHSTKCASCGPPLPRASIGNGSAVSHAPQRFHWAAGRSIWRRGPGCTTTTPGSFR